MPPEPRADVDVEQKIRELIILFILANSKERISILHLQKEVFLLWNFDKELKNSINFIKHLKGPFSRDIEETVNYPMVLTHCWKTFKPKRNDKLSGGFIKITSKGLNRYEKIEKEIKESNFEELLHLLSAAQIVTQIYNKLTLEELLLLIYDTYPAFTKKSSVYNEIYNKKDIIIERLLRKDIIDKEKCISIQRSEL